MQILAKLDGIETGVRQLMCGQLLETTVFDHDGQPIVLPTAPEILRIKGVLILRRNATRDYLDSIALATHIGDERVALALLPFDRLYPQPSGESALLQLQIQLGDSLR